MTLSSDSSQTYLGDSAKGEIQIISEAPVYENQYGTLYDDRVRFPSGAIGRYIRFVWKSAISIAVVPQMKDGRIALIRVFRHALRDWILEIPKGFAASIDEAEEIARIELREEAGLTCQALREPYELVVDPAFVGTRMLLFVAEDCQRSSSPQPEEHEAISDLEIYSRHQIAGMLAEGHIRDTVTLVGLLRLVSGSPDPSS